MKRQKKRHEWKEWREKFEKLDMPLAEFCRLNDLSCDAARKAFARMDKRNGTRPLSGRQLDIGGILADLDTIRACHVGAVKLVKRSSKIISGLELRIQDALRREPVEAIEKPSEREFENRAQVGQIIGTIKSRKT